MRSLIKMDRVEKFAAYHFVQHGKNQIDWARVESIEKGKMKRQRGEMRYKQWYPLDSTTVRFNEKVKSKLIWDIHDIHEDDLILPNEPWFTK